MYVGHGYSIFSLTSFLLEKPQSFMSYTSMEENEIHFPLLTYLEKFFSNYLFLLNC